MRNRRLFSALLLVAAASAAPVDVQAILDNRVTQLKKATGIVAGTVDATGKREVFAVGPGLNADSVFEIGSITKVFTSLLLADMIERGEVTPDTPVVKLLPEGWTVPTGRSGREITLLDLSKQVSGLPRLANNMRPADMANPYADYTPKQLQEFLAGHTLRREPGAFYEYSNLAVGLLGYALAQKSGMTYEALVKKRVLDPLGMSSTSITLSAEQQKRLAPGHDPTLKPVKNWDLPDAVAGAGALRSTVNDMLRFLAASAGWKDSPLKAAFARMRSVSNATGQPGMTIQMGWHVISRDGVDMVWHNGGTGGYRSFAGFEPVSQKAVVVLCNTSHSVDDIGRHILNQKLPLESFKVRTEITLPEETLDKYVGKYQMGLGGVLTVSRKGTRMFAAATGQGDGEIFAEKPGEFFAKAVDAQFSFVEGSDGKITHAVLHQNGRDLKMERIP